MTIKKQINFLTVEEVLEIHRAVVLSLDEEPPSHQEGVLRGCLAMPSTKIGGKYSHLDLFEMAAAYLFHLTNTQPFKNGNQKVAALSALYFLYLHDIEINADPFAFVDMIKKVAKGKASKRQASDFLRQNATVG